MVTFTHRDPRGTLLLNETPQTGTLCTDPERTTDGNNQTVAQFELCSEPCIGGPLTGSVTYFAKGDHSLAPGASATSKSLGKPLRAASQPRRQPSVAERAIALIRRTFTALL